MARYDPKHMSWMSAAEMNQEMFGLSVTTTTTREMAYIRRHPILGRDPVAYYTHLDRPSGMGGSGGGGGSNSGSAPKNSPPTIANNFGVGLTDSKASDFVCYSESEDSDDEFSASSSHRHKERFAESGDRISVNFVDCLQGRELGLGNVGGGKFFASRLSSEYGTRHMLSNSMLKEKNITVPNMNKVFCSQWLSDRQVVFGTKCNKVRLLRHFSTF